MFNINDKDYSVKEGDVVEIPPKTIFTYSGKMNLILINKPQWQKELYVVIKDNPNV